MTATEDGQEGGAEDTDEGGDHSNSLSAEVSSTSADTKQVLEGSLSDEVAATEAEMKMIELSQGSGQAAEE